MWRLLWVVPWIIAFAEDAAWSQPLFYRVESLEWMAADCPVIVRGSVVDFVREVGQRGDVWDTVVLKVKETIKGQNRPFHTFVLNNLVYCESLRLWRNSGREILVFLDRSRRVDTEVYDDQAGPLLAYEFTPRFVSQGRQAIIERPGPGNPAIERLAYTMDLKELTTYDAILRHVRDDVVAARALDSRRSYEVRWPKGSENIDRMVPVDRRLETLARAWARSDQQGLREEGAKALGCFKSDEVVAILKGLLEDPSYESRFEQRGREAIETEREFRVRQAAFTSLKDLGIPVTEPLLRVRLPQAEPTLRP